MNTSVTTEVQTNAEIRLASVKKFYSRKRKKLFDVAVDAVVRGCVSQYHYDAQTHIFHGTVFSLDGNEMFTVQITVNDKLEISAAACSCQDLVNCIHIGALALQSGYETPMFSYQCSTNNGTDHIDESDMTECPPQPMHEVFVKCDEVHPSDNIDDQTITCPSSREFWKLGNVYTKSSFSRSEAIALRRFKSVFGVTPEVCEIIWRDLSRDLPIGAQPRHLLWCLSFFKLYSRESERRVMFKVDEKTMRKWTWIFVELVSKLKVIEWEKRFDQSLPGQTCFTSLQSIDLRICEPKPFHPRWYSHKLKGAGLRYELAYNIRTGSIVWANGGKPCGLSKRLKLAKELFVWKLGTGERSVADKGYKDEKHFILPNNDNRDIHKRIMSHQLAVQAKMRLFEIMKRDFRHPIEKHSMVFHAVVNLTQLIIENGEPFDYVTDVLQLK